MCVLSRGLWVNLLKPHGVAIFFDTLKWDETQHSLSFELFPGLSRSQRTSSWSILVQRRTFGFVTRTGRYVELTIGTLPAVLVASKNAGCIWEALHGWASVQPAEQFAALMRGIVDDKVAITLGLGKYLLSPHFSSQLIISRWHAKLFELFQLFTI